MVEARNAVGYGPLSEIITLICAIAPSKPPAPTTSINVNNVIISWNPPVSDNGAPILSYKIFIR